jgi:hypothetical protein
MTQLHDVVDAISALGTTIGTVIGAAAAGEDTWLFNNTAFLAYGAVVATGGPHTIALDFGPGTNRRIKSISVMQLGTGGQLQLPAASANPWVIGSTMPLPDNGGLTLELQYRILMPIDIILTNMPANGGGYVVTWSYTP